jgi:hypothetical protein
VFSPSPKEGCFRQGEILANVVQLQVRIATLSQENLEFEERVHPFAMGTVSKRALSAGETRLHMHTAMIIGLETREITAANYCTRVYLTVITKE